MHPLLQSVLPATDFSVPLPSLGILQITGADAAKFLQGQITQDVLTMTDGEQRLGACCNAQGRMRAVFRLVKSDDRFLLIMPRNVIGSFVDAIKKYAAFFKVQMEDISTKWTVSGLYQVNETAAFVPAMPAVVVKLDEHRALHVAPGQTPTESADESRWLALDVIHRNAWVWPETVEKLLPHEIALKDVGGISFSKGCYTGQEIVARMEYRGKLKNGITVGFSALTERINPGTEVMAADNNAGEVLGAARHPIAGQLLLLNLKDATNTESLTLNLPSRPILQVLT